MLLGGEAHVAKDEGSESTKQQGKADEVRSSSFSASSVSLRRVRSNFGLKI
jgi:hypothetical protein